jgi:ABC-type sugar transport system ATPase subunit
MFIETQNIKKIYNTKTVPFEALSNINIGLSKSSINALIGASGSGKTTLLNIIGALDEATEGNVIIDSESLKDKNSDELAKFRRDNLGFIFQSYNLIPVLTAYENIALALFDMSENDKKELKIKKTKKTFSVPLAVYTIEEIENFKKNIDYDKKIHDFVYLGRINNHQKNICYIQTKFKNKDISYYGNDNVSLIKDQSQYKGLYNSDNLFEILEPYKYGLMLSKYEGFPYVLIEMLSHGIPCIIKMDSFAASNLFEISKLFTINSESELDSKINKILSIDSKEYKEISNQCFDYAIKNLSIDKFLDN